MKNEKGITLIALIITIIVMLILVAVTINVAMNGGLFSNATNAKVETQKELIRERLISAMVGGYNSSGKFVADNVDLPQGTVWCTEEETSYEAALETATSERNWVITENGDKYYIDSAGSVLDEPKEENNILVGKSFYMAAIDGNEFYEVKIFEVLSNSKARIYDGTTNTTTGMPNYNEGDYTYEDNLILGAWPVYVLSNNGTTNVAIVAESSETPGLYNVVTSNKGANITPLTGKTFKKSGSTETMEFFVDHDYGFVNTSGDSHVAFYALIDDGNVCKLYIDFREWNVTKSGEGEYISFSNGTDTYELYTP